MKLGIAYMVFDGFELLEYAIRSGRDELDFVSAVFQEVSFTGQPASSELLPTLRRLEADGLLDAVVRYDTDLSAGYKANELAVRNLGLRLSTEAGCSHHIAADVDEFYLPAQLRFAKTAVLGYDCSVAGLVNYFKRPTWRMVPDTKQVVSLIQPVEVGFDPRAEFPFVIEATRKPSRATRCRVFGQDEFVVHHMSYVRRDIRSKVENSSNWSKSEVEKFLAEFDKYGVGDRLCLPPDFLNRRTVLVEDAFSIPVG